MTDDDALGWPGRIEVDAGRCWSIEDIVFDSGVRHWSGDDDLAGSPRVRECKSVVQNIDETRHFLCFVVHVYAPTAGAIVKHVVSDDYVIRRCDVNPMIMILIISSTWFTAVLAGCVPADIVNEISLDDHVIAANENPISADRGVGAVPPNVVYVVFRNRDESSAAIVLKGVVAETLDLKTFHPDVIRGKDPSLGGTVPVPADDSAPLVFRDERYPIFRIAASAHVNQLAAGPGCGRILVCPIGNDHDIAGIDDVSRFLDGQKRCGPSAGI